MKFIGVVTLAVSLIMASGCATPQQKADRHLSKAKELIDQKNYRSAILELRNALKFRPENAEAHYQLALAYIGMHDANLVYYNLDRALRLDRNHAPAALKMSELLSTSGDSAAMRQAENLAAGVLEKQPNSWEALQLVAVAQLAQGNRTDAEVNLRKSLKADPKQSKTWITLAISLVTGKDYDGCEKTFDEAEQAIPNSPELMVAHARFYMLRSRYGEADKMLQRALTASPKYGPAMLDQAALQQKLGNMGQAEELFKQLAALKDPEYKALHAMFLASRGDLAGSITEYERLYKLDPADRQTRTRLVGAYVVDGRIADAERILNDALKQNTRDRDALLQRGELHVRAGRWDQAQQDLNLALRYTPESAEAHYLLAHVHRGRGNMGNFQNELVESLKRRPEFIPARLELAQMEIDRKNPKAAIDIIDSTPQNQRGMVDLHVQRNWALLSMEKIPEVRQSLDFILKQVKRPDLLIQDALVRARFKDNAGARNSLEEALKMNPDEPRAIGYLVDSYLGENRRDLAIERVREQVRRVPRSPSLHFMLGVQLEQAGDLNGARAEFQTSKSIDGKFMLADVELARTDIREKKYDSARDILDRVEKAYPAVPQVLLMRGMLEEVTGKMDVAAVYYKRVVDRDDRNVVALNNLAFYLAERDPDQALKYAEQARGATTGAFAALDDTLGYIYIQKRAYKTALRYLETKDASAMSAQRKYHLAMAYHGTGDAKKAREALDDAIRTDPTPPEAAKARKLILGTAN